MTEIAITQSESIEKAIAAALEHLPLSSAVTGRRVAIKPNETWASRDDTTGITQPDTLRAALRAVKDHGPRELIVTGGAGAAETEDVFRIGGLMDVVREEITVGHPAMIGTGPLGGHVVETGLVIASTDALAADVVGARLLGFTPQAVRHLWEAARLGIGESDIQRMRFPALSLQEAIGRFTQAAYGHRLDFEHA